MTKLGRPTLFMIAISRLRLVIDNGGRQAAVNL